MTTFVFATEVPNVLPSTSSWELVTNSRIFESPLTKAVQTAARKGAHWRISLSFDNLFDDDRANMQAFMAMLEGQRHRFSIKDHSFTRRGTGSQTGLVTAASSGGTLNCTRTLTSSLTVKKGDYLSANNQLFMCIEDVTSTSTTIAIKVSPEVRVSSVGQAVELVSPVGVFMMTGSTGWDTQPGIYSSFNIEAIEDVLA
jgi:hypothetical protein